jgi:hypothetical protein
MNTDKPQTPPPAPQNQLETDMDEFESSKNILKMGPQSPAAKYAKLGGIGVALMVLIGVAIYGVIMMGNSQKNNQAKVTPTPASVANQTPSPTPTVQYPSEYQAIDGKIQAFDKNINSNTESRTRLNMPQMNIVATFE